MEVPTGAGDGSWGEGERWRTADGVLISPSVNEVSKRPLLELPIKTRVRDCVGALQMEHWHVQVSIRSVGGAYRSWRWQLM